MFKNKKYEERISELRRENNDLCRRVSRLEQKMTDTRDNLVKSKFFGVTFGDSLISKYYIDVDLVDPLRALLDYLGLEYKHIDAHNEIVKKEENAE